MNNQELTISGVTRNNDEKPPETYIKQERIFGIFSRTVTIPIKVLANKASAKAKNGILTIHLPISVADRSEIIDVQVAD